MKFKTWLGEKEIELVDCPFCGGEPEVRHIGNELTKKRSILIKCKGCRCERTDSAMRHGFDWLEQVAAKNWNQRPQGKDYVSDDELPGMWEKSDFTGGATSP